MLSKTGGGEKRSTGAFLFSPYTKLYNHLACKDKQTTNLIAPCTVQVTYETPFVIDHAVQNPELGHCCSAECCCALTQLLSGRSSRIWELCSSDIQEQGLSFLFSLPSHPSHVSSQQDKLTELHNILQNNTSEADKLCILGNIWEIRTSKKNTLKQTERYFQTVLVLFLTPLISASAVVSAETTLNINN